VTVADRGYYIVLLSIHGLIRGEDPELGRDADTGSQVQYVLDLARTLSEHPKVERVELMTRHILSTKVDYQYGQHLEQIADRAWIVRFPCGPARYLHKESLWPYLPQFVDGCLQHFRQRGTVPDVVHGHYADAGEVALRLGTLLGVPMVYTGHSLGRIKLRRLMEKGLNEDVIEKRYRFNRRIGAEEGVLRDADLVIASTGHEADEQYGLYEHDAGDRMVVIPPGVDLGRFRPPRRGERFGFAAEIDRFLSDPKKPVILAMQRPDDRNNLSTLLRAYGESERLREMANLVLMIGTRGKIGDLAKGRRRILTEMLPLIDHYDLHGSVAYPKRHEPDDAPEVYRFAASRRGVLVNPALTEPFGLALIEAAASGLPLVATHDGGPREIVGNCGNGVLVDPLEAGSIEEGLFDVLSDRDSWRRRARAGVRGATEYYSWKGHVKRYVAELEQLLRKRRRGRSLPPVRMITADKLIVCDIDNTLVGDEEALAVFLEWLRANRERFAFGVATGRVLERAVDVLEGWGVPSPDVLITGVGSEIHYIRSDPVADVGWSSRIDHEWDPKQIRVVLAGLPGLKLKPKVDQRPFKLSYFADAEGWPGVRQVRHRLRDRGLRANVVFSQGVNVDLLPHRASKSRAVEYLCERFGVAADDVLVAGDSGNDAGMLRSAGHGVVVGNFSPELRSLRGRDNIYFARATHARGILEGIAVSGFLERG
jgi:sucrose-phosphate synthase